MSKSSLENTKLKKQAFLDNYIKLPIARQVAIAIGVNDCTHYEWLNTDEVYHQAFQELKKRIDSDRLQENEAEIHRRGLEKSDLLLMFETKKLDHDYRDKVIAPMITGDITIKMAIPEYDESLRLTNIIEGEAREVDNGQDGQGKDEALQGEKA